MIFVAKDNVSERSFVDLLSGTKTVALSSLVSKGSTISPDDFETLAYESMVRASQSTEFEGYIEQTGAHAFPDIIARKYFGAEVKTTTSDKWISTGNSILETTRSPEVERIYLFFGKLGGNVDIKYRSYQECLYDIGVTHSPRYKIDMDLPDGMSIFDKMGISYDLLRKETQPIKRIKDYFRKQLKEGQELWWIDSQGEEETLVSPVIRFYGELDAETKERFELECMLLFPEIFGSSNLKYERAVAYLITNYNAVRSSFRDTFTSGGQMTIKVKGKTVTIPKILFKLCEKSQRLIEILESMSEDKLSYYWRLDKLNRPRVDQWKSLLEKYSSWQDQGLTISDILQCEYETKKD